MRLLTGELRQGALAGVMVDAIAAAAGVPVVQVRRAAMYAEDLGVLAHALMEFHPAHPGHRDVTEDDVEVLARFQPCTRSICRN